MQAKKINGHGIGFLVTMCTILSVASSLAFAESFTLEQASADGLWDTYKHTKYWKVDVGHAEEYNGKLYYSHNYDPDGITNTYDTNAEIYSFDGTSWRALLSLPQVQPNGQSYKDARILTFQFEGGKLYVGDVSGRIFRYNTDGTGGVIIYDVNAGIYTSSPQYEILNDFKVFNNVLYISQTKRGVYTVELPSSGARLTSIQGIYPYGDTNSWRNPRNMVVYNNKMYLTAYPSPVVKEPNIEGYPSSWRDNIYVKGDTTYTLNLFNVLTSPLNQADVCKDTRTESYLDTQNSLKWYQTKYVDSLLYSFGNKLYLAVGCVTIGSSTGVYHSKLYSYDGTAFTEVNYDFSKSRIVSFADDGTSLFVSTELRGGDLLVEEDSRDFKLLKYDGSAWTEKYSDPGKDTSKGISEMRLLKIFNDVALIEWSASEASGFPHPKIYPTEAGYGAASPTYDLHSRLYFYDISTIKPEACSGTFAASTMYEFSGPSPDTLWHSCPASSPDQLTLEYLDFFCQNPPKISYEVRGDKLHISISSVPLYSSLPHVYDYYTSTNIPHLFPDFKVFKDGSVVASKAASISTSEPVTFEVSYNPLSNYEVWGSYDDWPLQRWESYYVLTGMHKWKSTMTSNDLKECVKKTVPEPVYYRCSDANQEMFRISSEKNAHVYSHGDTSAPVPVCYDEIFGQKYTGVNPWLCSQNNANRVIAASGTKNAHAEDPKRSSKTAGYDYICYGNLDCRLSSSFCLSNEKEVAALTETTNAHAGIAGTAYPYKVCCGIPSPKKIDEPCIITSVTIRHDDYSGNIATRGNGVADSDENVIILGYVNSKAACIAARHIQVDAVDLQNSCILGFGSSATLNGVNYYPISAADFIPVDSTIPDGSAYVRLNWKVPVIVSACSGKTVYAGLSALRDGGPLLSSTKVISNYFQSTGLFTFASPCELKKASISFSPSQDTVLKNGKVDQNEKVTILFEVNNPQNCLAAKHIQVDAKEFSSTAGQSECTVQWDLAKISGIYNSNLNLASATSNVITTEWQLTSSIPADCTDKTVNATIAVLRASPPSLTSQVVSNYVTRETGKATGSITFGGSGPSTQLCKFQYIEMELQDKNGNIIQYGWTGDRIKLKGHVELKDKCTMADYALMETKSTDGVCTIALRDASINKGMYSRIELKKPSELPQHFDGWGLNENQGAFVGYWEIPVVPNECKGKTMIFGIGRLYRGEPELGNIQSNTADAGGKFTFAKPCTLKSAYIELIDNNHDGANYGDKVKITGEVVDAVACANAKNIQVNARNYPTSYSSSEFCSITWNGGTSGGITGISAPVKFSGNQFIADDISAPMWPFPSQTPGSCCGKRVYAMEAALFAPNTVPGTEVSNYVNASGDFGIKCGGVPSCVLEESSIELIDKNDNGCIDLDNPNEMVLIKGRVENALACNNAEYFYASASDGTGQCKVRWNQLNLPGMWFKTQRGYVGYYQIFNYALRNFMGIWGVPNNPPPNNVPYYCKGKDIYSKEAFLLLAPPATAPVASEDIHKRLRSNPVEPSGTFKICREKCEITRVDIYLQENPLTKNGYADIGEYINIRGDISPDSICEGANHIQVDASEVPPAGPAPGSMSLSSLLLDPEAKCVIQWENTPLQGIYYEGGPIISGSKLSGEWRIPIIPDECKGKTVFAQTAALRYDSPDIPDSEISNYIKAQGSFKFADMSINSLLGSFCGDGITDLAGEDGDYATDLDNEECDDRNANDGDLCSNTCRLNPKGYVIDFNGLGEFNNIAYNPISSWFGVRAVPATPGWGGWVIDSWDKDYGTWQSWVSEHEITEWPNPTAGPQALVVDFHNFNSQKATYRFKLPVNATYNITYVIGGKMPVAQSGEMTVTVKEIKFAYKTDIPSVVNGKLKYVTEQDKKLVASVDGFIEFEFTKKNSADFSAIAGIILTCVVTDVEIDGDGIDNDCDGKDVHEISFIQNNKRAAKSAYILLGVQKLNGGVWKDFKEVYSSASLEQFGPFGDSSKKYHILLQGFWSSEGGFTPAVGDKGTYRLYLEVQDTNHNLLYSNELKPAYYDYATDGSAKEVEGGYSINGRIYSNQFEVR